MFKELESHISKAKILLEALPYFQKFRNKIFLIKIGGSAIEDKNVANSLMKDIVFMENMGINPIVVHGGGKHINKQIEVAGLNTKFIDGVRVTDKKIINIIKKTLNEIVSPYLSKAVSDAGGIAKMLTGESIFLAKKKAHSKDLDDFGYVGEIIDFTLDELTNILNLDVVPIISPIAKNINSQNIDFLNVNADLAAQELAKKLNVSKLIYISDVKGVMLDPNDDTSLIHSLDNKLATKYIKKNIIKGGMIPKVKSALDALDNGVEKVHMIDGRLPHSLLLEIFTDDGIGTEFIH